MKVLVNNSDLQTLYLTLDELQQQKTNQDLELQKYRYGSAQYNKNIEILRDICQQIKATQTRLNTLL